MDMTTFLLGFVAGVFFTFFVQIFQKALYPSIPTPPKDPADWWRDGKQADEEEIDD